MFLSALLVLSMLGPQDYIVHGRRPAAAGGSCSATLSDDFTSDTITSGDWTEQGDGGNFSINVSSGTLEYVDGVQHNEVMTYDTAVSSATRQFACIDATTMAASTDEIGVVLRWTATTAPSYMGYYNAQNGRVIFRSCQEQTSTKICSAVSISYCDCGNHGDTPAGLNCPADGDTMCWEISGTGTSTTAKFWLNPTGSTPDDWGAEDITLPAGSTAPTCPTGWSADTGPGPGGVCSDDATNECETSPDCTAGTCEFADTGTTVGLWGYSNDARDYDNFAAGSCSS